MQPFLTEGDFAMTTQLQSILCVDDDPLVLEHLTDFLTIQGFDVLTAANGVEAFLEVKQYKPRVVVMDLFMPQLGGLGALARMKALQPDIAVILISGVDTALDLVTEAGLTVTAALTKPLNLSDLLEALERSEEHTSELQSRGQLVCRLLLEKKKTALEIPLALITTKD